MTDLFVKPCCRTRGAGVQYLSSAKDGFHFVPAIGTKCRLSDAGVVVFSLSISPSILSKSPSFSSAFPRSRLTPTP